MKEITSISLERMNNGAHFMFVSYALARAEAHEAALTKAAAYLTALKDAVAKEDEVLTLSQKNLLSDDIAKADKERDNLYLSYKSAVKTFLKFPMEEIAGAAKVLNQHLKDYAIDPRMQLDRETGLLTNLITDLEGKYKTEVETVSLADLVAHLKAANEQVRALIYKRDTESSTKIVGALKAAREATDEAYRLFVRMVNSLVMVEGDTAYAAFIDEMNAQIARYRREVLGQTTSSSSGDTTTTDSDAPVVDGGGTTDEGGEEDVTDLM